MGLKDMFFSKKKREEAIHQYEERADAMDEASVESAASEAAETSQAKIDKLEKKSKIPKPLRESWDQIKLMGGMTSDYARGNYREVPWKIIASVTGALGYFVLPVDVIPDIILGAGYLDDAAVLKIAMEVAKEDIEDYVIWKQKNSE